MAKDKSKKEKKSNKPKVAVYSPLDAAALEETLLAILATKGMTVVKLLEAGAFAVESSTLSGIAVDRIDEQVGNLGKRYWGVKSDPETKSKKAKGDKGAKADTSKSKDAGEDTGAGADESKTKPDKGKGKDKGKAKVKEDKVEADGTDEDSGKSDKPSKAGKGKSKKSKEGKGKKAKAEKDTVQETVDVPWTEEA